GGEGGGAGRERLLPVAPGQEFQREDPKPPREMRRKEHHQDPLGRDDDRLLAPLENPVECRLALERLSQHEEVRRQEERQRDSGDAMHEERPPAGVIAKRAHDATTANTARRPSASNAKATAAIVHSAARPRKPSHSPATPRSPIAPWIAAARTKSE